MLIPSKVAVIITTYNRHKNLITVIEQLIGQSCVEKIEKICVSDGFDEEVKAICSYYKLNYLFCEKNNNLNSSRGHLARDTGIQNTTSEFLCLWDDDNYYNHDAIENLLECVRKPQFPLIRCTNGN